MKILNILKYFGLASIVGCTGLQQSALPTEYTIKMNENGGMVPYGTTIFLSNQDSCYVEFYVDGLENKINIFPTEAELIDLVKHMKDQKFSKIKTREMEALDRGGDSISVTFDGKKTRISNMGFSFIKDRWTTAYSSILDRIFAIAKNHLPAQLQTVEINLDESMLKENWRTSIDFNNGIFIGQSTNSQKEGFQSSFKVSAIPGQNMVYIHILSDVSGQRRGETLLNWSEPIRITKGIHKMTFKLIDGDIRVIYNEEKQLEDSKPIPVAKTNVASIIEKQNLNNLSEPSMLQINVEQTIDDPEYDPFEVTFSIKNKESGSSIPLLTASGSFKDTYADIHYALIETGNSLAPYLLFFSGQAGDEYNTPGMLVLFDQEKKISELQLHEGNRINAELMQILPDMVKVKEAIMCHQEIQTSIAFSENGLERLEGFFPVNTVYPDNGEVPEPSSLSTYTLKSNLTVTINKQDKTFKESENITLILQWVDFDLGSVFLKVNEEEAYIELEKFKAHEFVQSMYGAKCEMG